MADSSNSLATASVQTARDSGAPRAGAAPWLLAAPALLLFCGLLLVPLLLTEVLSFHAFDGSQGVLATYTLANYAEVLGDSYYHEIFLRTAGMALAVTVLCVVLGVPETDSYQKLFRYDVEKLIEAAKAAGVEPKPIGGADAR